MTDGNPVAAGSAADKLNAKFIERKVEMLPCNLCGEKDSFSLVEGYFPATISPAGDQTRLAGIAMPLLPICCRKCGNTLFINALAIGLGNYIFDQESPNVSA